MFAKYLCYTLILFGKMLLILSFMAVVTAYRPRVIGGHEADIQEYPYVVSLQIDQWTKNFGIVRMSYCTGSLISSTWVITAAHCFTDSLNWIRYGDMTLPWNVTTLYSKVLKIIPQPISRGVKHLFYPASRNIMFNDIGLIMVENTPLKTYAILSSVDYRSLVGLPVSYMGFGKTSYAPYPYRAPPYIPLESNINTQDITKHNPLKVGVGVVTACQSEEGPVLCVSEKCHGHESSHSGDSGGPVFHEGKLVGVISGRSGFRIMSIMTPVSRHLEWVSDTVRNETYKMTK